MNPLLKTLYLRIYLTVVAALLLFALVSGWLLQRNVEHERAAQQAGGAARLTAWAELLHGALPPASEPQAEQAAVLLDWSERLRLPLALDGADGQRIATSPAFERALRGERLDHREGREPEPPGGAPEERRGPQRVELSDGRTLWILRPARPPRPGAGPYGEGRRLGEPPFIFRGAGLLVALAVLFVAVAAGAWPVVRRLTRRLEALQRGVEAFGAGALHQRVDATGRDEVAAVAASFNRAAERVESLLQSHRSLLANASHELRSPLARLKMALALLDGAEPARREALRREIELNIAELDTLVEEVLLASRLDAQVGGGPAGPMPGSAPAWQPVDLPALCAEEAARAGAAFEPPQAGAAALPPLRGDERLLRRAVRNLLENARRYGGQAAPEVALLNLGDRVELQVSDRGPGVPPAERERIFEPFYRLPGHAEQAGGTGLGLSLVRQIAVHHGGQARCEAREGGGSRFIVALPAD